MVFYYIRHFRMVCALVLRHKKSDKSNKLSIHHDRIWCIDKVPFAFLWVLCSRALDTHIYYGIFMNLKQVTWIRLPLIHTLSSPIFVSSYLHWAVAWLLPYDARRINGDENNFASLKFLRGWWTENVEHCAFIRVQVDFSSSGAHAIRHNERCHRQNELISIFHHHTWRNLSKSDR